MEVVCAECGKHPDQISEYVDVYEIEGCQSPDEYVIRNEGTFNRATGKFYCTVCYVKAGMPLGKA